MDIFTDNGHGNSSSNPLKKVGKIINPTHLFQAMGKIVGQIGLHNLGMFTDQGEKNGIVLNIDP